MSAAPCKNCQKSQLIADNTRHTHPSGSRETSVSNNVCRHLADIRIMLHAVGVSKTVIIKAIWYIFSWCCSQFSWIIRSSRLSANHRKSCKCLLALEIVDTRFLQRLHKRHYPVAKVTMNCYILLSNVTLKVVDPYGFVVALVEVNIFVEECNRLSQTVWPIDSENVIFSKFSISSKFSPLEI